MRSGDKFRTDAPDPLMVTGVCKDWPTNSHFTFDILLSNSSSVPVDANYVAFNSYTYLLLR